MFDVHGCGLPYGSSLTHISRTGAPALTAGEPVARGKTTVCRATNAHDRSRPDEWSAERTMGLSWQQGPLGRDPNGQFLVPAMPERVLYAEPLRRRLRAELGGRAVVQSDDAVLLFEPGRYPVAYFPLADFAEGALRPIDHRSEHPDLGETAWFEVIGRHAPGPPRRLAARRAARPRGHPGGQGGAGVAGDGRLLRGG